MYENGKAGDSVFSKSAGFWVPVRSLPAASLSSIRQGFSETVTEPALLV